tara:strand:+ start:899 stop:1141 length:243 start_codon:yes stop_codon:yes gene_type:complete
MPGKTNIPGSAASKSAYNVKEYWVFYDKEIVENNPDLERPLWCFVDVRNGVTEWFKSEKEANIFLEKYHLENDGPITYLE